MQFHRGTYTSHGKRLPLNVVLNLSDDLWVTGSIKKGNRKSEILLRDVEVGCA
jgi:hypothetical protein